MRIVSLLPSATEIINQLGLLPQLVGVTHECDYPPQVKNLPKVTNTLIPIEASSQEIDQLVRDRLQNSKALYTLDLPTLERLQPDLIVTQALCDVCAVAESEVRDAACSLPGRPAVINLEPNCLADIYECMRLVASATGISDFAEQVIASLKQRVESVTRRSEQVSVRPKVVVLEWVDPPYSAGHWIPELVRYVGGEEAVGREANPSHAVTWERVREANPDVMLVTCCGYNLERSRQDLPILAEYPGFYELDCVRNGQVYLIDGNSYLIRPGPRLVDSLELIAHILHPDRHEPPTDHLAFERYTTDRLRSLQVPA